MVRGTATRASSKVLFSLVFTALRSVDDDRLVDAILDDVKTRRAAA
jgi:hypothetical protein